MKRVQIVGAGQLGSRHLQALKSVETKLEITVVDPSRDSLMVAKDRFEGIGGHNHDIKFSTESVPSPSWDLVIVASNSGPRAEIVAALLSQSKVEHLILEKLLFTKEEAFKSISEMVKRTGTKTWVNCAMRQMPIYQQIRQSALGEPIRFNVVGSRFGLVTNAIHYFDALSWMAESTDFVVDVHGLSSRPIESKRKGYLEFDGHLTAQFSNGSFGALTCFSEGSAPVTVEIATPRRRFLVKESEQKAWKANADTGWKWDEIEAKIPYQSELTSRMTRQLFETNRCDLPTLDESVEIHLRLLRPLARHMRENGVTPEVDFPFT